MTDMDTLAKALLANRELRETESYLTRGRAYKHLSDPELKERWITAFQAFAASPGHRETPELDDLRAELALRDVEPPLDRVKDEFDSLVTKLKQVDLTSLSDAPEWEEEIAAVLAELEKPRN
jgi:hypothetical protein